MNNYQSDRNLICFYHENEDYGCFSNWFSAEFENAKMHFHSVEQYMMYHKVLTFGQYELADRIMESTDPHTIKKLGRTRFPNFDAHLWDQISYAIVKRGVRAKFQQNPAILNVLLETENKLLAESARNDLKWGIGVAITDPNRYNVKKWNGKNYLGRILMEVRDELRGTNVEYIDAMELDFSEWHMSAGELVRIPKFRSAIKAFSDTLRNDWGLDCFYNQCELYQWEVAMNTNMGGGLPVIGFWEMKQDLYDIIRFSK